MAKITPEQIEANRLQFDFDKLLEPYREGGTEDNPVPRTMGTIIDYLLNKKKYSLEVTGAAILTIFMQMNNGKKFEGDGSYGSSGRELVTAIRIACDKLNHQKLKADLYAQIAKGRIDEMKAFIENQVLMSYAPAVMTPWIKKGPFSKYRKWKKAIKKHVNSLLLAEKENVAA